MYVDLQQQLPLTPQPATSVQLTMLVTPEGPASVHWRLMTVPGDELLATGAVLRPRHEEAAEVFRVAFEEAYRAALEVSDPEPFP